VKVILVHGGGSNGRIASPIGILLRQHGYSSVSPDLPGYGVTTCAARDVSYDNWISIVADLVDAEIERDGKPVVLLGASLGGMLAYQAACKSRKAAGVIATTLADPSDPDTRDQLARNKLLARIGGPMLRGFRFMTDPMRVPIQWVSRMRLIANNPGIVELLIADRTAAGSWIPLRFMRTLMDSRPLIEPERFDLCPVLLAHPEIDHMTPLHLSKKFFERLGGEKELVILEKAGHMPLESPGIDLLENAVLRFLRRVVAQRESTAPARVSSLP